MAAKTASAARGCATAHRQAVEAADALRVPLPAAMITNRWTASELGSYEALRDRVLRLLDVLPDGTSELFLHPAPGAVQAPSQPVREWELRLLSDDRFQQSVDDAFVRVASWGQDEIGPAADAEHARDPAEGKD